VCKTIVSIFSIFFITHCIAQNTNLGLNPPSVEWQQIDTEKAQIIFPETWETQAQRIANLIHYMDQNNRRSIGDKSKKISVILQNQSTISNGFVATGPHRAELFTMPPQFNFLGTGNWLDLLTIHEYRHVQQLTNAKTGITGLIHKVLGDSPFRISTTLSLPRWYFEGDAIVFETALTDTGRGSVPDFLREYRALVKEERKFGYEKASARSLKDFVPDHWHLGYLMNAYVREQYGQKVFEKALKDAVSYRGIFYPFNRSLKKQTGNASPSLYEEMWNNLSQKWPERNTEKNGNEVVNKLSRPTYINYRSPFFWKDGVIVEKDGFNTIRTFYLIDQDRNEKKITSRGINVIPNPTLSVNNNLMVWAEARFGVRWLNEDYSVIVKYDLEKQRKEVLTHKTQYFSPSISPDGAKIVAVEYTETGDSHLIILNAENGQVLKSLANRENLFYAFPQWDDEGEQIISVARKGHQNALISHRPDQSEYDILIDYNQFLITEPFPHRGWIFFSASFTGIDNIFALNTESDNIFQVTDAHAGAYQASVSENGEFLVYSDYTSQGYDIKKIKIDPANWEEIDLHSLKKDFPYTSTFTNFEGGNILAKFPDLQYPVRKYKPWHNLINVHSFEPFIIPPQYGLDILSKNKMTSVSGRLGYRYNTNENFGQVRGELTYGGFFPLLHVSGVSETERERFHPLVNAAGDSLRIIVREWEERDISIGTTLPLNVSHHNYAAQVSPFFNFHFIEVEHERPEDRFRNGSLNAIDFGISFSRSQATAPQFILPRFAQILDISYKKSINNNFNRGAVFQSTLNLIFPGLFKNHGLWLQHSFKSEDFTDDYKFPDLFVYPRGYPTLFYDRINRFSFNYVLPLFYPDIGLGPIAFLKRIKANLFFDYTQRAIDPIGQFVFRDRNFNSTGIELTVDLRFLRLFEIDTGLRYSHLLNNENVGFNANRFDFILRTIN